MGFDSLGLELSSALRVALEKREFANAGVLAHMEFEELSWITDALPADIDDTARIRATQELSELWQHSASACRHEIRSSAARESERPTLQAPKAKAAPQDEGPQLHDPSKRRRLDKLLGKNVLEVKGRVAMATIETIGDADNKKKAGIRTGAEDLAEFVWKLYIDLGTEGNLWSPLLNNEAHRNSIKAKKIARWSETNAIKEHVKFAKAWFTFCDKNSLDARQPDALASEMFCCSYAENGPTQPKAAYNSLRWLQHNVGLNVNTDNEGLRRATDHPDSHEPKSEEPWPAEVWAEIEKGTNSKNVFISAICLFFSFLFITALRPIHLQRAVLRVRSFLEFNIKKGKRIIRGRQQPIFIGAPMVGLTGVDLAKPLEAYLAKSGAGTEERPFFLAEFYPENANWSNATAFTSMPMGQLKARRLVLKYLESIGMPRTTLASVSGIYGVRHVLPSIADRAHTPDHERDCVGDWKDGKGRSGMKMRDRYSYARAERHAEVREALLIIARRAVNLAFKLVQKKSEATWEFIYEAWPKGHEGRFSAELTREVISSKATSASIENSPQSALCNTGLKEASCTSSESDSSESECAEAENTEVYNSDDLENLLPWVLPRTGGSLHSGSLETPTCGRMFVNQTHGFGLIAARDTKRPWCGICFKSLPPEARKWWSV
jgi:hypothetical protein